jgi:hypothetical protein
MDRPAGPSSEEDSTDAAASARDRARRAGNLLHAERFAEALVEYDWVWRHLHHAAPDMAGVRASFTASEIGLLCRQFATAQLHFEAIRDEVAARLDAGGDGREDAREDRLDWMVLNEIVGQAERTLVWFDQIDVDELAGDFLDRCVPRLVPLLRRRGRWADIGKLFRDPLAKLREDHATMMRANQASAGQRGFRGMSPEDLMKDLFREQTHIVVRGLRAAGRADEATALAREALALDDSAEMREALAIGAPPLRDHTSTDEDAHQP